METHHRKRQKALLERCAANSLQLTNVFTGRQIYVFCQQRKTCRRCAEYYRYRIARLLNTVEWQSHVVLLMKIGENSITLANLQHQARCWQALKTQLGKYFPRFYYAWFREIGATIGLHLHVLWSIPIVDNDLLSWVTGQAGFGYARIESIGRPGDEPQLAAINYVTKTLATIGTDAEGAWLRGTRRHQISTPVKREGRVDRVWVPSVLVR